MGVGTGNYALGNLTGGAEQGGTMSCVKSLSRPGGKVTVDLFCPLWRVANENEACQSWITQESPYWKFRAEICAFRKMKMRN